MVLCGDTVLQLMVFTGVSPYKKTGVGDKRLAYT